MQREARCVSLMSIKQNAHTDPLPDFRNLGVIARILVGVNLLLLAANFHAHAGWGAAMAGFVREATFFEPALMLVLLILYAGSPWLAGLRFPTGHLLVLLVVALVSLGMRLLAAPLLAEPLGASPVDVLRIAKPVVLAILIAMAMLAYLRLHARAFSPALAEARLQALQARIRPHFLFNSLNAVITLVRKDPRRAERALEDLADLFRVLMSDGRRFVRLADEVSLIERYASIEQLRLGERLNITWELDAAPLEALLPPLVLQPLLENAVFHGVEPGIGVGHVLVRIELRQSRVNILITNPYYPEHANRSGNRMALENLKERLQLFFDAEARILTRVVEDRFEVEIEFPMVMDRLPAPVEGR